MSNNIKVSIVVPVCNVEPFLRQCLDSIVCQTLEDIEIICVDDGSTDNCPVILDEYASKYDKIKVVHKANAGYGHTMNVGMDMAQGEYIGIVESDDFIEPNMFEIMYNKIVESKLDCIRTDYHYYYDLENGEFYLEDHPRFTEQFEYDTIYEVEKLSGEKFHKYECIRAVWSGLYKTQYIRENNIKFNETPGASFQDVGFTFITAITCKKFMVIPERLYYYRKNNPNSSVKSKGKLLCVKDEYEYIIEHVKKYNIKFHYLDNFINYCFLNNWMNQTERLTNEGIRELYEIIRQYVIDTNMPVLNNNARMLMQDYERYITMRIRQNEDRERSYKRAEEDRLFNKSNPIKTPEEVCVELVEKMSMHDNIVVYGAGIIGQAIYDRFEDAGILDKIDRYVVTKKKSNDETKFNEIPLFELSELVNKKGDVTLIIASTRTNLVEMIGTATELGFTKILTYYDIV